MGTRNWKGNGHPAHRLHGKYHGCDRRAVRCFIWMHDRCRKRGIKCFWPRTREGYDAFYAEMGPIPKGIKRASIGRRKHDLGYEPGNVKWEPYSYNRWKTFRDEQEMLLKAPQMEPTTELDREDWDLG